MRTKYFFLLLFFTFQFIFGQTNELKALETKIATFNDRLEFEKSIVTLENFISNRESDHYDKYFGLLLKSYTYKRLFNYTKTLNCLELANQEGVQSDRKDEVIAAIKAEKSFVYFDTHDYTKADILLKELVASNYKYLSVENKIWVMIQEGYLLMREQKYTASEQKYNQAISIMQGFEEKHLPNIYGKKIELYSAMKLQSKRDEAFEKGLFYAKKYKIIKYEMYLYEIVKNELRKENNFKRAFEIQQKYDEVALLYNAVENDGKIELLESKLKNEKQDLILKNERYFKSILFIIVIFLSLLSFLYFKLNKVNKEKRALAEMEYKRIYEKIQKLTYLPKTAENKSFDLNQYSLTERQNEIVELIKIGKSNKEIAVLVNLTENTVKYHLKAIYTILNVNNRTEI